MQSLYVSKIGRDTLSKARPCLPYPAQRPKHPLVAGTYNSENRKERIFELNQNKITQQNQYLIETLV